MISKLHLKFGKSPDSPPEVLVTSSITVFVGPNNSGKSRVLAELHRYCTTGQKNSQDVIIGGVEFTAMTPDGAANRVKSVTLPPARNETVQVDHIIVGKRGMRVTAREQQVVQALMNPNKQPSHYCQWFLAYNTMILDGPGRIGLVNSQSAGDLQLPPHNTLQFLFRDDAKRMEVRRIIYEALGYYLVIDPTNLGNLRLRLSSRPPREHSEERGIDSAAVEFHGNAMAIENASDGVKAFTGMITEIMAGDPEVLLIDEPEAFLHPSLAFRLGVEIGRASAATEKRLFVSTHSPYFVMGCIQSGVKVNIVRLTYRGGLATSRLLANDMILRLMRNPLLRSTNVISALFYEFVVITEADADRAFYQEVNERLLRCGDDRGIPNCLFINAQNKQTVHIIMRPLRDLGISVAAVVDIDIVDEGGQNWAALLSGAGVPEVDRASMALSRSAVHRALVTAKRDYKRDGGVSCLDPEMRESAWNLLSSMANYGLFAVPNGELESWLPALGASGHGPAWLIQVFEKMGEDPEAAEYARPAKGDVWDFIARLKAWLVDGKKKGVPA